MPIQVLMPALSLNTAESKITRWEKKEGDKVSKGDIIFEVESDKATMEIEAAGEGILHILVREDIVPVNTPVALLIDEEKCQKFRGRLRHSWRAFLGILE
jgi:pyruvate dehydrogenase E1 component subunit beta